MAKKNEEKIIKIDFQIRNRRPNQIINFIVNKLKEKLKTKNISRNFKMTLVEIKQKRSYGYVIYKVIKGIDYE